MGCEGTVGPLDTSVTTDMPPLEPARLLALASGGAAAVNRILGTVRQAGLELHAELATSLADAETFLASNSLDLVLCLAASDFPLDAVLALLGRYTPGIPLLLIVDTLPAAPALYALHARGVSQVVPAAEPGLVALALLQTARSGLQQRRLRQQELALHELEQRHRQLLEHSPLALAYLRDGMHLDSNPSYRRLFGLDSASHASATPLLNLVPAERREDLRALLEALRKHEDCASFTTAALSGAGDELRFDFSPVRLDGKACLQVLVRPAPGNAGHEAAVAEVDARDLSTTLESRHHFLGRLEGAIRRAIQQGRHGTLIVLQLDNFHDIAGTLGRGTANRVLQALVDSLPRLLPPGFAAGRLDQDCIGILLDEGDPDQALALCQRLADEARGGEAGELALSTGFELSSGVMLVNGNALDAEDLVIKARVTGHRLAKAGGGQREYRISNSLEASAADMLAYLRRALDERRFRPVFQPVVALGKQQRRCYELLIRMLDLDGNEIPPGEFIHLATVNGLGEDLDRVVAGIALDALRDAEASQQLIINITESTLLSRTFLPWLRDMLDERGLAPDRLLVDISEISLHTLPDQALAFCHGLQELGIGLMISHFGCALAPLKLVRELAPAFVTLDASLARNLVYSETDQARTKDLIAQVHAAALEVVIPRVENMATLPLLWDLGADYIQGFSVQAPRHAMDFEFVQDQEITVSAPGPAGPDVQAG